MPLAAAHVPLAAAAVTRLTGGDAFG